MTIHAEDPAAYLPRDRLRALASGQELPERTSGSALFADISGFTALTSRLTRALGLRRGAEELPRHLDRVYQALIEQVHAHGGSVISFAGDAITCWFDADHGARATSAALALQRAMEHFREVELPDGSKATLALKVAVATGSVRRMVVGNPEVQLMDVIAGDTLVRLAAGEALAASGEVILDAATVEGLSDRVRVAQWRESDGQRFAAVTDLTERPHPKDAEPVPGATDLTGWLLPAVQERLQAGQGEFLTELRPVVALFLGFAGIDYDNDAEAPRKLDCFIRRVQAEAARLQGSLLQLTIGDKGSYLYLAFGAPVSNEDDARRAVTVAWSLLSLQEEFDFITSLRIGISQGTMRTGAYGGHSRRTYGALGDETNMAARLMGLAASGQVLAGEQVARSTQATSDWRALEPVSVKGRSTKLPVFELLSAGVKRAARSDGQLIGRKAELDSLLDQLELARGGSGQTVRLLGEAGIGKTGLVNALLGETAATTRQLQGEAEAFQADTPYGPWRRILEGILELPAKRSREAVAAAMGDLAPALLPRLPLLAPVLSLALPDNQLTASLDAELRKAAREALILDLLRHTARGAAESGQVLLLVIENEQWLDPLSRDLLAETERLVHDLPILLVITSRPTGLPVPDAIRLKPLGDREARELLQLRLTGKTLTATVRDRLLKQAEGNPHYLEELASFVLERGSDSDAEPELPASLHSLVLSRLDRLSEQQKALLKAASVFGRSFRLDWLNGYHPALGGLQRVRQAALELGRLELTSPQGSSPLVWLFRQLLTRDVSYGSIPYSVRATLHERLARYVEEHYASETEPMLELLALHYGHGEDLDKKREYLLRAGMAAQDSYANESALLWFGQVLPLLEPAARPYVLQRQGQVQVHLGKYAEAEASFRQALLEAGGKSDRARSFRLLGELKEKQGDYAAALDWLEQARTALKGVTESAELIQVLLAEGGNVLWQQGEYELARERLNEALQLATASADNQGTARALHGLGNIELYQGNLPEARRLFGESLAKRRQAGDSLGIANALNNLGIIAASQEGAQRARELFEESLQIRRAIGDRAGTAVALNNVGFMAAEAGDAQAAETMYRESLRLRREIGDRLGTAVTLNSLGHLQWQRQLPAAAAASYSESLQLAQEIGNVREVAAAVAGASAIAVTGDPRLAARFAGFAAALLKGIGAATEPEVRELLDTATGEAGARLSAAALADATAEGQALQLADGAQSVARFLSATAV